AHSQYPHVASFARQSSRQGGTCHDLRRDSGLTGDGKARLVTLGFYNYPLPSKALLDHTASHAPYSGVPVASVSNLNRIQEADPQLRFLTDVVSKARDELKVKRVILFGSRARGDHQPRSDVDLAFEFEKSKQSAWNVF